MMKLCFQSDDLAFSSRDFYNGSIAADFELLLSHCDWLNAAIHPSRNAPKQRDVFSAQLAIELL